ncbi:inactive phospholipase D5-like isoform X2 [Salminus brasiliensis]|uniref:inactive phospholipase D5-like isoform X2 n=1 Tax=Salminus brasiliensis TaxID=930266 RepID=UPI003B8320E8
MKSQQKCIVIFALVCCFAVLVALIFSAVDVLGEDEDGINEENCSRDCEAVLVENIPEDISIPHEGTVPLVVGLHRLLSLSQRSVEIVSPLWELNSTDHSSYFTHGKQGQLLLQRLMGLKVSLKVAYGMQNNNITPELKLLEKYGAEVHDVNMTALTRGELHSSFWVVDRKHMYIGSAGMDWRSLSTRKELGVIIYNCSCLVLDLHRIFSLYRQLQYRDFVPAIWSKRLAALYNKERTLKFHLNGTNTTAYFSTSPDIFCPKDRNRDIESILHVIQEAKRFIYISITDYLPLIINNSHKKYWSRIDGMLREALILKHIKIRLLISCREQTHPLTFNFLWSLKSLCMEMSNCSMEVKFFSPRLLEDGSLSGINHHRYMVTDNSVYIGNFDWVANEFMYNAGVGLVISKADDVNERSSTVVEQAKAVFERDWRSTYSKTLQPNKIPTCSTNTVFPSPLLKGQQGQAEHGNGPNTSL